MRSKLTVSEVTEILKKEESVNEARQAKANAEKDTCESDSADLFRVTLLDVLVTTSRYGVLQDHNQTRIAGLKSRVSWRFLTANKLKMSTDYRILSLLIGILDDRIHNLPRPLRKRLELTPRKPPRQIPKNRKGVNEPCAGENRRGQILGSYERRVELGVLAVLAHLMVVHDLHDERTK